MVVSHFFGGKSHVSNGQHVSFKEPCYSIKSNPPSYCRDFGLWAVVQNLGALFGIPFSWRHLHHREWQISIATSCSKQLPSPKGMLKAKPGAKGSWQQLQSARCAFEVLRAACNAKRAWLLSNTRWSIAPGTEPKHSSSLVSWTANGHTPCSPNSRSARMC